MEEVPPGLTPEIKVELAPWGQVKSKATNPEAISTCLKCSKETLLHINYQKAGIVACRTCYSTEEIVNAIIKVRHWTLDKISTDGSSPTIYFKCDKGHTTDLNYESLKRGSSCKSCNSKKKPKIPAPIRPDCNCAGKGKGKSGKKKRPRVCPHWNHLVACSDSAREWDYEKNKPTRPENVAPGANKKYHFK